MLSARETGVCITNISNGLVKHKPENLRCLNWVYSYRSEVTGSLLAALRAGI